MKNIFKISLATGSLLLMMWATTSAQSREFMQAQPLTRAAVTDWLLTGCADAHTNEKLLDQEHATALSELETVVGSGPSEGLLRQAEIAAEDIYETNRKTVLAGGASWMSAEQRARFLGQHKADFVSQSTESFAVAQRGNALKGIELLKKEEALVPRIPGEFACYPNPFRESAELHFSSESAGPLKVSLVSLMGQTVQVIFDGETDAAQSHFLRLDGSGLNGVYLVRIEGPDGVRQMKISVMK